MARNLLPHSIGARMISRIGARRRHSMLMLATPGALTVKFGSTLEQADTRRLADTLAAFAPVSRLTLDFSEVRALNSEGLVLVARMLRDVEGVFIRVRSLSHRHLRVLQVLGVPAEPGGSTVGPAPQHV